MRSSADKKAAKATASVQSLSGSQLSDDERPSDEIDQEKEQLAQEKGPFSRLLARPFNKRRIILLSLIGLVLLGLIVLVIVLPLVLIKRHSINHQNADPGNTYHLFPTTGEDNSYRVLDNNPIFAVHNFPDPGLLHHNATWYAYGTNPKKHDPQTVHVPVATSTNFVNWTLHDGYDAMPTLGDWELAVNHWAPDVIERDDGKFVMYYSGQLKDGHGHHCIGAAVSTGTDPMGPFVPLNASLACPQEYGGAIDPSPFRDVDGKLYVVYKGDGNSVGSGGYCGNSIVPRRPVPLILQELERDGITKVGEPDIILEINDTDGPLIEAPNIIRRDDGTYFLFFSSHCFTSLGYNVKYAHARSVKGPYSRAARPLLQTEDFGLDAPGGATLSPDGTKIVFHANCGGHRCMYAGGVNIQPTENIITMAAL
ncbi:Arabinan endo-1,5-alpha-L-arabinanase [Penicillium ucsense]|uniref:Arabinan endo-1,5-alpha-L-arabinanase n=1 Tax=Penicillium ucsense TaxID=2839758 RepID=A0A8J8W8P3_9EURO|nr:Arabinan endo-1,5-alpha-L-arabinanase [Penicillium ucsense]KAF7736055.1 Arabinan endo-1,5-alpha-L-arabinanase [Penicillium ucsense]